MVLITECQVFGSPLHCRKKSFSERERRQQERGWGQGRLDLWGQKGFRRSNGNDETEKGAKRKSQQNSASQIARKYEPERSYGNIQVIKCPQQLYDVPCDLNTWLVWYSNSKSMSSHWRSVNPWASEYETWKFGIQMILVFWCRVFIMLNKFIVFKWFQCSGVEHWDPQLEFEPPKHHCSIAVAIWALTIQTKATSE